MDSTRTGNTSAQVLVIPNETTATTYTKTSVHNRTTNTLSQDNLRYIPQSSYHSLIRFTRAPRSSGPYYATATMEMRSSHAEGLSNQIYAVERIFKSMG
ncbi:hypothetical protein N7532_005836 [Penicillium argentinense]|uniref:Uncharacterized protein n=1 Tax=Penicillium argentinense TaxID=1131581 RepID=A0A9W9KAB2_9EURO|nr:uncharacterized protein N7532_005836 [Penicillium argentinense]KAJ5098835.1 hypothetical protein N7532_005836 [Penicillium argentinense]